MTEQSGYASQRCLECANPHIKRHTFSHTNTEEPAVFVCGSLWSVPLKSSCCLYGCALAVSFWGGHRAHGPLLSSLVWAQLFDLESRQGVSWYSPPALPPSPCPVGSLALSFFNQLTSSDKEKKNSGSVDLSLTDVANYAHVNATRTTCHEVYCGLCTCGVPQYTFRHINATSTHRQPTCHTDLVKLYSSTLVFSQCPDTSLHGTYFGC